MKNLKALREFLDNSPTCFQAAENIEKQLLKAGYEALDETRQWKLTPGKGYFVSRNKSAVIAFRIGSAKPDKTGFRMAAAHLDSPALKLKPASEKTEKSYLKMSVEIYGVPIISSWLDRELSIAGKVMVKLKEKKNSAKWEARLVDFRKPLAVIPNPAFHLNRDVNKGFEYNAQNHLPVILLAAPPKRKEYGFREFLAEQLKVDKKQIGEFDLFLYDANCSTLAGIKEDLLVSGRLDDLAMSYCILESFTEHQGTEATTIAVFYDSEEIGNETLQGAKSSYLSDVLHRINLSFKLTMEQQMIALRKSFLVSTDMAHAYHPNFAEKHDPAYRPLMNHGLVIKFNAGARYATTSETSAAFEDVCEASGAAYQKVMGRSDIPSGYTIGPTVSTLMGIPTVDIGLPMWAMHSARETMGVADYQHALNALKYYYQYGEK